MLRALLAVSAAVLLGSCTKPATPKPPQPPPPAGPVAWLDARVAKVSTASPTADRTERLELRHDPDGGPVAAHLRLVLVLPEGEQVLVDAKVPLAQRDAAWAARFLLVPEPPPGTRRAISWDGAATYAAVFPMAPGKWVLCPHKKVEAVNGTPDWPKMLTLERWATGVLETAVWACDASGAGCKSQSLAGMTVHHSEPDGSFLPSAHEHERGAVLPILGTLKVDRFLGAALLDAAVTYQRGLGQADLETLGQLAAKALGAEGPFSEPERKVLRLRVLMARDEVKKAPTDQLSPRASVDALRKALADLPEESGR